MGVFIEALNWWYTIVIKRYFEEKVMGIFFFFMNKTRALPFAKTFNVPLYHDTSEFGKSFGKIVKFWWIGAGTIYSIIRLIPAAFLFLILMFLPIIPLIALVRFLFSI